MSVSSARTLYKIDAELAAMTELRDSATGAAKGKLTRQIATLTAERDALAGQQADAPELTDGPVVDYDPRRGTTVDGQVLVDPDPRDRPPATPDEPAAVTLDMIMRGVKGLGASTIAKVYAACGVEDGTIVTATPDQVKRARQGRKPNLKGKDLGVWVITGDKPTAAAKPSAAAEPPKAPKAPKTPFALPDGMTPAQALTRYVVENISDDPNAAGLARPFITHKGRLFVHNVWFRDWLSQLTGATVPAGYASKALADAGFKHRSLPVVGAKTTRMAIWVTDDLPRGTGSLPRQPAPDAS